MHGSIIKEIDLSNLPRRGKGQIDWKHSVDIDIPFTYGTISGIIKIKECYPKKRILVEYKGNTKIITTDKLRKLQIGDLLGKWVSEFRYGIGNVIKNKRGLEGEVVDCFRNQTGYRYYKIKCSKCGTIFIKLESNILNHDSWCPICDNKKTTQIVCGINDMWTTRPDLAEQLFNPEDGYTHSCGTGQKLKWKCSCCGKEYDVLMEPYTVIHYHHGVVTCKRCNTSYSYPNRFIYNILESLDINFIPEYRFPWSQGRRYDFYLPDDYIIIEAMGNQHYVESGFPGTLEERIENDRYKKELALNNGFLNDNYLSIDCRKSVPDYIFKNLKNSKVGKIYDFDSIDVFRINYKTCQGVIPIIVKMVNEDMSILQMSKELHMNSSTITTYVQTANELGLCNYDKEKMIERGRFSARQQSTMKVS